MGARKYIVKSRDFWGLSKIIHIRFTDCGNSLVNIITKKTNLPRWKCRTFMPPLSKRVSPCLSLWERWPSITRSERVPSQSAFADSSPIGRAKTLSVTCGCSPKGRAKDEKGSVSGKIRSIGFRYIGFLRKIPVPAFPLSAGGHPPAYSRAPGSPSS